jgi:hypothetical protein
MPLFAQAQKADVSKKQDLAVFALGYQGFGIPRDALAAVDSQIQSVFVNLGRFNVLGQTERFSNADVKAFIAALEAAKAAKTELPDEVKFGDVQLTEALLNKLYKAFVVVIPTVVSYESEYNSKAKQYETTIKTSFAFVNVAEGVTFGYADITSSGFSEETKSKSVRAAIDGIAGKLTYEIRKIPVFTINTKVLQVKGGAVKMQLGKDMGIQRGDEYILLEKTQVAGFSDDREAGLLIVSNVGSQVSTATVLYADDTLVEGAQLREIPRMGADISVYGGPLSYFDTLNGVDSTFVVGMRAAVSRGFYNIRPLVGIQVTCDSELWVPIHAYFGLEGLYYMRRLCVYWNGAVGGASNALIRMAEESDSSDDDFFTHYGAMGGIGASFLITRDIKVFAEAGAEYWASILGASDGVFASFGGYGVTAGLTYKF